MQAPDLYRKACSEGMRLSGEKLEEMIVMTENRKRALRRPVQIALAAAAMMAVLCVTAAAANPEAVQRLWKSFSVSVLYEGGNTVIVQTDMPDVTVERAGERVMLTVDDVETDITEALDRDGVYRQTFENETGTAKLTVQSDLSWEMELLMKDGQKVSYNSERFEFYDPTGEDPVDEGDYSDSAVTYTFTDDETMTGAVYLPPEE